MRKGRDHHNFKDGYFSGYSEYRYGSAARVTLAGKTSRPIISQKRRVHIVDQVIDLLKGWEHSPFEREADIRHGLRRGLCLDGHNWARSDIEAENIVAAGLQRLGAKRPSWAEGQPHYTDGPDTCALCKGSIANDDRTRGQRFCSAECARMFLTRRDGPIKGHADRLMSSAEKLIQRLKSTPRPCAVCGTSFRRSDPAARFCSLRCAHIRESAIPERQCQQCGAMFRPSGNQKSGKFCSKACQFAAARILPDVQCPTCQYSFKPRTTRQIYCSKVCGDQRHRLSYVLICQYCRGSFESPSDSAMFCGTACRSAVYRLRKGDLPRRLSPPAFDYIFKVAA